MKHPTVQYSRKPRPSSFKLQASRFKASNLVSVGDVGYVREGCFFRMFNVPLEWNDPLNYTLCELEPYSRLDLGQLSMLQSTARHAPTAGRTP